MAIAIASLCLAPAAPAKKKQPKSKPVVVSGRITYAKRRCFDDPTRAQAPVPDAHLKLTRAGLKKPVVVTLAGDGSYRKRLRGHGHVHGKVVLDGFWGEVTPKTRGAGGAPYSLPIDGDLARAKHVETEITGAGRAGATNIWSVLDAGAHIGKLASPKPLHRVTARWGYDISLGERERDIGPTRFSRDDWSIEVAGPTETKRYEWESWPLLHEYMHSIQETVAPGAVYEDPDHILNDDYPERPGLAWNEGLANAFAAIVHRSSTLDIECGKSEGLHTELGATPATPRHDVARAQYNEVAVAGAVWHLTGYLGHGDRVKGLRTLLTAVSKYKVNGHPPHEIRDVRDALFDENAVPATQQALFDVDKVFYDQYIGWGVRVTLEGDDPQAESWSCASENPPTCHGTTSVHLRVAGPYGACEDTNSPSGSPHVYPEAGLPGHYWFGGFAPGGMHSIWQDDCFVQGPHCGSDACMGPYGGGAGTLWMLDPYLVDAGHRSGAFTVYATYECREQQGLQPCLSQRRYRLKFQHGFATKGYEQSTKNTGPLAVYAGPDASPRINSGHFAVDQDVTLELGVETPIASFNATGAICQVQPIPAFDCRL